MTEKPTLDNQTPQHPETEYHHISTNHRFIGYALLFVGGCILTGAGAVSGAIGHSDAGWLIAAAGGIFSGYILYAMFFPEARS